MVNAILWPRQTFKQSWLVMQLWLAFVFSLCLAKFIEALLLSSTFRFARGFFLILFYGFANHNLLTFIVEFFPLFYEPSPITCQRSPYFAHQVPFHLPVFYSAVLSSYYSFIPSATSAKESAFFLFPNPYHFWQDLPHQKSQDQANFFMKTFFAEIWPLMAMVNRYFYSCSFRTAIWVGWRVYLRSYFCKERNSSSLVTIPTGILYLCWSCILLLGYVLFIVQVKMLSRVICQIFNYNNSKPKQEQKLMAESLLRRKVAIIGCGPVGMLGSLLLQHLGIEYVALQKYKSPRSHPSAHWLSANSKVIMSQVPGLVDDINGRQEPWDNFRYYRYMESLLGHQLGITDHFKPTISQRLHKSVTLFGETPNHIPQNTLLELMYDRLKNKDNMRFDTQIRQISIKKEDKDKNRVYVLHDQYNNPVVEVENVILCSGVGTDLRSKLPTPLSPFRMEGNPNLMNVINIHFTSKQLANLLKKQNKSAMLHFLYGKKTISILVNHSIEKTGTFVLQIPNYDPFVDLLEVYSARELIHMIFEESNFRIDDLTVVHVGKWRLQGLLADSMHKNGIFLAGDAAHAYPPAGGFGMNSGFQDIHELVHAIFLTNKNKNVEENKIYSDYSQNRRKINFQYLTKAMQNYEITKKISMSLGYSPNILDYFSNSSIMGKLLSFLPENKSKMMEPVRLQAMKLMYRRKFLNSPALDLFFDQFDHSIQKLSKVRGQVMKNNLRKRSETSNFYACQGQIDMVKIKQVVGDVDEKNISFFKRSKTGYEHAQRLIASDGNIVAQ